MDSKSGITVKASLEASTSAKAEPETGGKFNWSKCGVWARGIAPRAAHKLRT